MRDVFMLHPVYICSKLSLSKYKPNLLMFQKCPLGFFFSIPSAIENNLYGKRELEKVLHNLLNPGLNRQFNVYFGHKVQLTLQKHQPSR